MMGLPLLDDLYKMHKEACGKFKAVTLKCAALMIVIFKECAALRNGHDFCSL